MNAKTRLSLGALCTALFSTLSQAQSFGCSRIGDGADAIMQVRQFMGLSYEQAHAEFQKRGTDTSTQQEALTQQMTLDMLYDAYRYPLEDSEDTKNLAVYSFRRKWETICGEEGG
ncbi:hypothetical protein N9241_01655 [bacterium]|nr:hypothetical protein [bacterium]